MSKRILVCLFAVAVILLGTAAAQMLPWFYWTLLPQGQRDEIIGEASGESAWNHTMELAGYDKDRLKAEYAGTFYEAQYVYDMLKRYGLPGAEIVTYPGGEVWDAVKGELWEVSPRRQKLSSATDMTVLLVRGSNSADVKGELVWVGRGTAEEIERAKVDGKIVVTDGNVATAHNLACMEKGALGVVAISDSRPHFDPLQIPFSSIRGGSADRPAKFAFYMTARDGEYLKQRLLRGQKITAHAQVETTMEKYVNQNVVCHIPGTDPAAGEVILSAHLFEGYTKQGANDNGSGSGAILDVARTLHTLIQEGRLPRPKRTIRFLWGPEFAGTGPWVKAHKDLMAKTLCNINMDMVGEWLSRNKAHMMLIRTTFGNPHYINDVMENYYRFVGEGNRERIHNRGNELRIPHRLVAPSGADEPFYYSIETHYGASDHEVFNDWGVRVPGIMMIAWPDQWYHTSGDRTDKADPTQLKRVVFIGAAGAYTVAAADDDMAVKIAGEVAANGARRLGYKLNVALEALNVATVETLAADYRMARIQVETTLENEKATLQTVLELGADKALVGDYVGRMAATVEQLGKTQLAAVDEHMKAVAKRLKTAPVTIKLTELEAKAAKIVPRTTAKVKENGYRGYQELLAKVPEAERKKHPFGQRDFGSLTELHLLINGKRSALDILNALDAQYPVKSNLQSLLNYLEILKLAGLVEM